MGSQLRKYPLLLGNYSYSSYASSDIDTNKHSNCNRNRNCNCDLDSNPNSNPNTDGATYHADRGLYRRAEQRYPGGSLRLPE
jgi:hypothetical protein